MRLYISCMQCLQELKRPTGEYSRVEFCDDGRYEITCSLGHKTTTILRLQRFEVLFDIGAYAILDGYYREAVSSFTSSLERFYEFATHVLLESAGVSDNLHQGCWKKVSSQSERQLGAFIFLWVSHLKETPELLPDRLVKFRNEVIHKGKIPNKKEAIEYGNAVLDVLRPKMEILLEKFTSAVDAVVAKGFSAKHSAGDQKNAVAGMWAATIVSLKAKESRIPSLPLIDHLARLEEFRQSQERMLQIMSEFHSQKK